MRLNRGCGCLLLVLAGLNFLFVIAGLIGVVGGNVSIQLGLLALTVFGANLVASLMLGLAGLRGQRIGATPGGEEVETAATEAGGTDVDEGSD